ncbi:MAG: VPLPA-CTERM sorting domain-containing protein [Halioglobus sp.]
MNKLLTFASVAVLSAAASTNAATIQDRVTYRASTDIYLGDSPCVGGLCDNSRRLLGNTPTSNSFQFNMEYDGVNDAAVEAYNDNNRPGLNFANADNYGFTFGATGTADWIISGGGDTPFSGDWYDIDNNGNLSDGDFLSLAVLDTPFLNTEVAGYTYREGGTDTWLSVEFSSPVPVPAAAWLFGSALLGLGAIKRKRG